MRPSTLVLLAAVAAVACGDPQGPQAYLPIELDLGLSDSSGTPQRPIQVDVAVANRGSRTVYYFDDCSPVDVTLYAVLPTGESARIAPSGFCSSPPQCCAPLAPAAGFQGSVTFDGTLHTALGTRVATPGEYTLVARFSYTYAAWPVSPEERASVEVRVPFTWSYGPTP